MNKQKLSKPLYRPAQPADIHILNAIEKSSFNNDRLNMRSFRRWIQAEHGIFTVVELEGRIVGYGLVWCHKGTRLARLYSIAVLPEMRGKGIAASLLKKLEEAASKRGRLFMRLEVGKNNTSAIQLYQSCGYRIFGEYSDYYEDHSDALRMQKTIQQISEERIQRRTPWYQQTTEFSCGPAALMMAMASLDKSIPLDQALELDIWREATTIFMTAGHGGCHPLGLALAAQRRGFDVDVFINKKSPLFVEGVRSDHKKEILTLVHQHFVQQVKESKGVELQYRDISQKQIENWLKQGWAVVMLISTYQLDGRKAPHWVTVTSIDPRCLYVHDPDPEDQNQLAIDCQYLPIAREDFDKMSAFGAGRLRTALAIRPVKNQC